jgi:subtilase family serine protease
MLSVYPRSIHFYNYRFTRTISFLTMAFLLSILVLPIFYLQPIQTNSQEVLDPLTGMIPPLLAASHLQGSPNLQQRITLSIGLCPLHLVSLHQLIQTIVQSHSHNNRHFLTPDQYAATYSPSEATYTSLTHFLQHNGFTITHTYNHRLLVDFSGTIQQVEQAFHVTLHTYSAPDGHSYYANNSNPLLPVRFAHAITAINGLDNALHWYPTQILAHHLTIGTNEGRGVTCPRPNQGYLTPNQFAGAYNLNRLYQAHLQGQGQTIALFELSPFVKSDIMTYNACFSKGYTTIQAIQIGKHLTPDDGTLEAETDAELVLSAVPRLKTLKIYEAGNDVTSYISQWARIIQDAPPVVSTSWGLCEKVLDAATIKQENILFTIAAAQGQTIFASTGDTGSAGCLGDTPDAPQGTGIDDPAAQPFVTSVGGTSLSLEGAFSYGNETTWNTTRGPKTGFNGASGGGISQYWIAPSWQKMPGVQNAYSTGKLCHAPAGKICREIPDVSLHANANHGYLIYCSARATKSCSNKLPWSIVGGTSTSAPLWAALAAIANEISLAQDGYTLGFINPLLYQIARDPQKYAACFHDITTGNNDNDGLNNGRYPATRGYDMATGLGSYNAYLLAFDLVAAARQHQHR